ncbi:hypothetical protein TIFTF001_017157 [Ficus carica]|uniref:Uncharacterized protein n=1 Tax=Ficus carica TaxID=3494 RepID=A0AA88AA30_FICCA|nr:hypothetical protein TIFTF001_017157 [Ficus carica]
MEARLELLDCEIGVSTVVAENQSRSRSLSRSAPTTEISSQTLLRCRSSRQFSSQSWKLSRKFKKQRKLSRKREGAEVFGKNEN